MSMKLKSRNSVSTVLDVDIHGVYVDNIIRLLRIQGDGDNRFLETYWRIGESSKSNSHGLFERTKYYPGKEESRDTVNPDALPHGYRKALLLNTPPADVERIFGVIVGSEIWDTLEQGWYYLRGADKLVTARALQKDLLKNKI